MLEFKIGSLKKILSVVLHLPLRATLCPGWGSWLGRWLCPPSWTPLLDPSRISSCEMDVSKMPLSTKSMSIWVSTYRDTLKIYSQFCLLFRDHIRNRDQQRSQKVPLCCCFAVPLSRVPWNGLVREVPEAAAGEGDPIKGGAAAGAGAVVVKPVAGVAVVDSATVAAAPAAERGRRREDRWCWSRSCRRGDTIPHVPSCSRTMSSLFSL